MDTKTIITPIGSNKVELKEWITGKEYEETQKPYTDAKAVFELSGRDRGTGRTEVNVGEAKRQAIENAIKIVVISIDGEVKDILKKVQEMRKDDYLFVLKEVDKVVSGENFIKPEQKQEGGID
jgi:hypothetical protein